MTINQNPTDSRVKNENGQLRSVSGPYAVEAFRLKAIILGLAFKRKTGLEITRGVRIMKLAKETTGLKTNDYDKLDAALKMMFNACLDRCEMSSHQTPEYLAANPQPDQEQQS
jgi:hypothetical protein